MKQSFENFKQEVYRRREEKLEKERKVKKRILAFSIPLILTVGIFCLTPFLFPAMEKSDNAMIAEEMELSPEATVFTYDVTISIDHATYRLSKEDSDVLLLIVTGNNALADEFTEESETESSDSPITEDAKLPHLLITLKSEQGETVCYQLEGHQLKGISNKTKQILTENELQAICKIKEKYHKQ